MAQAYPVNRKKPLKKKKHGINVTASIYYPEIAQTDSTPLITADGSLINQKKPRKHRWVALSRNLLKKWGGVIDYGDSLRVKGISRELDGIYVVRDTMKRRLRNRVDILVGPEDNIMGRWKNVQIYHLN
jgi:3D (Asp-Asp-Asp) domain-containing protein